MTDTPTDRIRALRTRVADLKLTLAVCEDELARLLAEAGRRPPDGSDQPVLFEAEHPGLF